MPTSPYKVKFNMGENATDSNPPIEAGQILLDKAQDKQCLFVDVDDSTRLQVKDPTKMDKWGEVHSLDSITYIEPSTSIILGYGGSSGGTPTAIRGLRVDEEEDGQIGFIHMNASDGTYPTTVSQSVGPNGVTSGYANSEIGTAQFNAGYSLDPSLGLVAEMTVVYDDSEFHYEHGCGISSSNHAFAVGNVSCPVNNSQASTRSQLLMDTYSLSLTFSTHTSTTRKITFLPDTDTEQFLIHGVCNPKKDIDAANKQYVDSKVSEVQTTWIDW